MFSYTEQDVIIIEKAKRSSKQSDITIGVGMTHMGQTIHFIDLILNDFMIFSKGSY